MAKIRPSKIEVAVLLSDPTVYGRDEIVARALEAGAVDSVVKPFSPTELAAKIRAALRRGKNPSLVYSPEPFNLGDLVINYAQRSVTVAGRPVPLTAIDYRLLCELLIKAGRVLTHDELLDRVWGIKHGRGMSALSSSVKWLRSKLGDNRQQSEVHLHPASFRIPHAQGRRTGGGDALTRQEYCSTSH